MFELDPDIDLLQGSVINTRDVITFYVITFYGDSVRHLEEEMKKSVDEYPAFCRERRREPEKPL